MTESSNGRGARSAGLAVLLRRAAVPAIVGLAVACVARAAPVVAAIAGDAKDKTQFGQSSEAKATGEAKSADPQDPGHQDSAPVPMPTLAVIALDAAGGRAVVRWPDGRLEVVSAGDALPPLRTGQEISLSPVVIVRQVLAERVEVEEVLGSGSPELKRRWWIFKAEPGSVSTWKELDPNRPEAAFFAPLPDAVPEEVPVQGSQTAATHPAPAAEGTTVVPPGPRP